MFKARGFTLIEILVVVSIISVLSSIILSSLQKARVSARDRDRALLMNKVKVALELYRNANRSYPVGILSDCNNPWGYTFVANENDIIPGLVPNYIPAITPDPLLNINGAVAGNGNCHFYYSWDGTDYYFIFAAASETNYLSQPTLIDPARDSGPDLSKVDGNGVWAWKVYSPNYAAW